MSTRSRISIINNDGTVRSIYCHWDGYRTYVGALLFLYYKDADTINKLMDLGDISTLGKEPISKPEYWNMDASPVSRTKSYADRGEKETEALKFNTVDEFYEYLDNGGAEEFNYLFKDGKWYWYNSYYGDKAKNFEELYITDIVENSYLTDDEEDQLFFGDPGALNNKFIVTDLEE